MTRNDSAFSAEQSESQRVTNGAGLASAAVTPQYAFAADTAPKKVRMGMVGGGFGCQWQFHLHPDSTVEAVSDLIPERRDLLAKTYQCAKTYNSLEDLVKDPNIDAVAIFTEAPNHVKHVIEAMNHGKHVFSAVPACYGSLDDAYRLQDIVQKTGLTYMMAETSYYSDIVITARDFYDRGEMGDIVYCEAEYFHTGLESLYWIDEHGVNNAKGIGKRTWRYGHPPMWYATHNTSYLIGITGERMVDVSCLCWGDDSPILKDNDYKNPYWNGTAMFRTNRGNPFRFRMWLLTPTPNGVRAEWYGTKMSLYTEQPNGTGPDIYRSSGQMRHDEHGYPAKLAPHEKYKQRDWYKTELLPEPLRIETGHVNSHGFLTHEFVSALTKGRRPTVDVYEALAYTVPGIIAHQSALKNGEQMKIPQFERPGDGAKKV